MHCPNCEKDNIPGVARCAHCGARLPTIAPPVVDAPARASHEVRSHLTWAILTSLLCSFPIGIVAVVHAYRVSPSLQAGDVARARQDSRKALRWAWLSVAVAVAAVALYLVLAVRDSFSFGSS